MAERLDGMPILALIESALGLSQARAIAAVPQVARLAFGSIDFAADLGCAHTRQALLAARSELVLAARLARIAGVWDPRQQVQIDVIEYRPERVAQSGVTLWWLVVVLAGFGVAALRRAGIATWPVLAPVVTMVIGVLGAFTGGITATAGGISAAIFFGYLAAVLFKPKMKA